jgi:hypothetical protein
MSRSRRSHLFQDFFHPGVQGLVYGLIVLLFLVLADQLSIHYGLRESQRVVDDICGATVVGLFVCRYERGRARYLRERLKTIELMNHHVRNAMQVIVGSVYVHGHAQQLAEIQNSVKRIDWALREILPGRVLDEYDAPEVSSKKQSKGTTAA